MRRFGSPGLPDPGSAVVVALLFLQLLLQLANLIAQLLDLAARILVVVPADSRCHRGPRCSWRAAIAHPPGVRSPGSVPQFGFDRPTCSSANDGQRGSTLFVRN